MSPARATRQRQAAEPAPSAPPAENLPALADDPRVAPSRDASLQVGASGIKLTTLDDAYRFAQYVEKSKMCPEGMKAADVVVAIQTGAELGFSPIRSLVACPVVKGRASIAGEAALALIRASGTLDPRGDIEVGAEGTGKEQVGWCVAWRRGWQEPRRTEFSYVQAETAGLTKKTRSGEKSMYDKYGEDMLIWRAASRMAKRNFSDITLGLELAEVARELPTIVERDVTPPPPPAGTPGGQSPDPLLAAVIEPQEAITPEVLPAEPEPEPAAEPEPADEVADLGAYSGDAPEPAEEVEDLNTYPGDANDGPAIDPMQATALDPLAVAATTVNPMSVGSSGVCGNPDPEADDVFCMGAPNHDGRCDWDIPTEEDQQSLA